MLLGRSIRIIFALSAAAVAVQPAVSRPARAHDGGAIAAGVAGGVAGAMAGTALQGTLPPQGYYGPAYPPVQDCVWEQQMVQQPYHMHIGQVRVCQ
ncbi:MAG TPA: hypothetical protein VL996_05960 [Methylocella sp.]|nr:hypothetical protein [Methylocella sp.]